LKGRKERKEAVVLAVWERAGLRKREGGGGKTAFFPLSMDGGKKKRGGGKKKKLANFGRVVRKKGGNHG